ncbi:hypothetical protein ONZ51_g13293 [Trametes cubensis]|uniref:Uncharacterized protein n=1 Tax=Trametes cubensis TaxID=1111947 RepID=A0AAD7X4Q5_9APHY|nr:hypothetical protein ONZ51_g13293 [Trametes cubensis]
MAKSRSVVNYSCKRISYHTPLSFGEVRARLDRALNKPEASAQVSKVLYETNSKAEFESGLTALLDGRDFMHIPRRARTPSVGEDIHRIPGRTAGRRIHKFGNPFFGQSVLRRAMWMGLHVPEKLLLLEDVDGNGTTLIYDEPADIIPVPAVEGQAVDEDLSKFIPIASYAEGFERNHCNVS